MNSETNLPKWIQEHKVCWDAAPLSALHNGMTIQVGFELHLYAQHEDSVLANPGCSKCQKIFEVLQEIAQRVMPTEQRPSRYEIAPFDASFHLRPENHLREEVQLTIQVLHRQEYFDPVDECEKKCLAEMEKKLSQLGVQSKSWREK